MTSYKLTLAGLLLVGGVTIALPAMAATDEECNAMWTQADVNRDGKLTDTEAERYAAWMRVSDRTMPGDGVITQSVFLVECKADTFRTATVEEGAPFTGANSFTEDQAKDRAIAAGFTSVSTLKQDENGIWRGTAMRDGKSVNIAVDYKGNVVAS